MLWISAASFAAVVRSGQTKLLQFLETTQNMPQMGVLTPLECHKSTALRNTQLKVDLWIMFVNAMNLTER